MIKISGTSLMQILKRFFKSVNAPYKLIAVNEDSLEEVAVIHLTKKSVYIFFSSIFVGMFLLFSIIILFTPLKYYIPGNNQNVSRYKMLKIQKLADSLQLINQKREQYLYNLITIANGKLVQVKDTSRLSPHEIEMANQQNDLKIDKAGKYDYLKVKKKDTIKTEETVNKDSL